ncbi:Nucleotide-sugar transporter like protein [Aduncisulcus paluster]|uniref:Nucleotide-sugar transporter like protein n=1 Tax=Aduncisulcus paluster TaxID=2918883 RepID=A0ABQ5K879_9EUKA|nr:Nucleotide-sugar transporter like protein [Aduncisulcus paluster]
MESKKLVFFSLGLLIFGAFNTIDCDIEFSMSAAGRDGVITGMDTKPFVFWTFVMFFGMSLSSITWSIEARSAKKKSSTAVELSEHRIEDVVPDNTVSTNNNKSWHLIVLSTLFNMLGSCCINCGFALGVPPSVFQFLCGSVIIFSALCSTVFLRKKPKGFQWYAIVVAIIGLGLVAITNAMNSKSSSSNAIVKTQIFAMGLVVLGQVFYACEFGTEEKLLKTTNATVYQVVASEGLLGILMTVVILAPLCWFINGTDNGHIEDVFETFIMIKNNPLILLPTFGFAFSIFFYTICGQHVTKLSSCVHRTLIEALRSVVVWVVSIIEGYTLNNDKLGEKLTWWSLLEVIGFVLITYGTFIYYQVIKHEKMFNYQEDQTTADDEAKADIEPDERDSLDSVKVSQIITKLPCCVDMGKEMEGVA